jgi:uncharacterized protein
VHRLASSFAALLLFAISAIGAEVLPPAPTNYVNDYAGVLRRETVSSLNEKLADFERATTTQIFVAIFQKMESDSSIEDYAQRVYDQWKVGQQKLNNGAILFVFVQDHKMRIHTGYGLEGALPDITSRRIIGDEIAPRFKANDFDGGIVAGVNAMIQATRGEYIANETGKSGTDGSIWVLLLWGLIIVFILSSIMRNRGTMYRSRSGPFFFGGGGGGWGGGGGFGGGGGGFGGGGGGMSGGGGASGSW